MFVSQSLKMISQVGTKQLMALWQPSCSLLAAIASRSRNWNGGCESSVESRRAEEQKSTAGQRCIKEEQLGLVLPAPNMDHIHGQIVLHKPLLAKFFKFSNIFAIIIFLFGPFSNNAFFPATKLVQLRAGALSLFVVSARN